ncbi:hypothetical protein EVAR_5757_1 [Eumeta japonica]|uniref:Uncharacterized protein n=1 Tax=Eumeta variegata TaxID=151549 RepID=A0A4C1T474_EUMVA|nr:hypothetical protein EVAR_5757_1 [Eumeta japonica]
MEEKVQLSYTSQTMCAPRRPSGHRTAALSAQDAFKSHVSGIVYCFSIPIPDTLLVLVLMPYSDTVILTLATFSSSIPVPTFSSVARLVCNFFSAIDNVCDLDVDVANVDSIKIKFRLEMFIVVYSPREYATMYYCRGVSKGKDRLGARLHRGQLEDRGGLRQSTYPDYRVFLSVHNAYINGYVPGTIAREGVPFRLYRKKLKEILLQVFV